MCHSGKSSIHPQDIVVAYFNRASIYIALLMLILVETVATRFYGIDRLSLWADEIWVVNETSHRSLLDVFHYIYYNDNHPPGYYVLMWVTQLLWGSSDFIVRLPSVIAGIFTVMAVFFMGRRYFSLEAGILAAALIAGSFVNIYYSQEARANILVSFFALLALHFFWEIVFEKNASRKNYLWFWLSATLCCYLHYVGLVFIFLQGLFFLIVLLKRRTLECFQTAFKLYLPVLVLYVPWLGGMFEDLLHSPPESWQTIPDLAELNRTFLVLSGNDSLKMWFYRLINLGIFGYVISIGARHAFFRKRFPADELTKKNAVLLIYILTMMYLPILVFYVKSQFSQPVYNFRHFIYILPMRALLAGYISSQLLKRIPDRYRIYVLALLVLLILVYQNYQISTRGLYSNKFFKEEYREAATVVAKDKIFISLDHTAIISTNAFFDHYLAQFMKGRASDIIYTDPGEIAKVKDYVAQHQITQFYYLSEPATNENDMITEEFLQLAGSYQPICRSKLYRVQAFKFIVSKPGKLDIAALPLCPYGQNTSPR